MPSSPGITIGTGPAGFAGTGVGAESAPALLSTRIENSALHRVSTDSSVSPTRLPRQSCTEAVTVCRPAASGAMY